MAPTPTSAPPGVFAVIMAGGSGTRFWPASRGARPKQFLPIAGGKPLLTETYERLTGLVDPKRVLVVTAAGQVPEVRACLPRLAPENVLAEPCARNTAAAVGLAAHEVRRRDPRALQVVLPADHVISPPEAFREALGAGAAEAAESGALVTFGIAARFPATGFGYIENGELLCERGRQRVHRVLSFREKPDRQAAERFLASGRFTWNAGIFAWTSASILGALARHAPALSAGLERIASGASLELEYPRLEALPIDVAVLEKAADVRTIPTDFAWSDVGSWAALPEVLEPDAGGNFAALAGGAELVAREASDCVVYAEGREVVALVGVRDLVVVHARGATLICPRARAQEVKEIVELLRQRGRADVL
jgi:mannose-1-phosphate guanylyltransferase